MLIESSNNSNVKRWMKLKQKKYRSQFNQFIVEGEHLVLEALKAKVVKEIIIREHSQLPDSIQPHECTVYQLKESLFIQLASTQAPQSVMAVCEMKQKPVTEMNRLLLLDRVQDPGNLGTLLRSAVAFGFDGVILGEGCVDGYNEKVIRSTQGAIFTLAIESHSLSDYIKRLMEQGIHVFGTSLYHGSPLSTIEEFPRMAFMLGNEGSGVQTELLELTHQNIFIEMSENIESLNVSIAGSIIMYHFRQ